MSDLNLDTSNILKITEHFIFMFDKNCPKSWVDNLSAQAEKRFQYVLDFFKAPAQKSKKKTIYKVNMDSNEKGRYAPFHISCSVPMETNLLHPFVHEEVHNVTFIIYGKLPCFWFEGIAEYLQRKIAGEATADFSFLREEEDREKFTNFIREHFEWLITEYDYEKFAELRSEFWLYTLAENFIDLIIENYGVDFFLDILKMMQDENIEEVHEILKGEIMGKWISSIKSFG